jgi:hypothetical protein
MTSIYYLNCAVPDSSLNVQVVKTFSYSSFWLILNFELSIFNKFRIQISNSKIAFLSWDIGAAEPRTLPARASQWQAGLNSEPLNPGITLFQPERRLPQAGF